MAQTSPCIQQAHEALLGSDLTADFPALSTRDTALNTLPIQPTSFIGREQEVATVRNMLLRKDVRLLTLTGPGGVGKTRLLLAVAEALLPDFAGMVCFVPLAAISDPAFVLPAIAQALGLRETVARSPREQVRRALGIQSVLLLLDNFEQVLSAAPALAELLATCPNLRLLVSSRAPLRLQGEHEVPVSPLPLPDPNHLSVRDDLESYAACTLFIQRAQAIAPAFRLTEGNAHTIAEICMRLDGLPLAIELAAARIRLLSPQALLARLTRRLDLLTDGARDLPARQQTLRAAIAWSYQLLTPDAQKLFRFLAVFAGGCTLQALETIAERELAGVTNILDGLSMLVENNLVLQMEQPDGEPRLQLLETVQEYGLECLADMGELEAIRASHAAYYLALAEKAEAHLRGPEQRRWMAQLVTEQENLRATLRFLLERAHAQADTLRGEMQLEQGEVETASALPKDSLALTGQTEELIETLQKGLGLTQIAAFQGHAASARLQYQESPTLLFEHDVSQEHMAFGLEGLAALEAGQRAPRLAARYWETKEGRSMTPEQILALQLPAPAPPSPVALARKSVIFPAGLTAREVEVLRLVAQGMTDAQVAAHLVISPRTVNFHLTSVYRKIGVSSRSAATRYAMEQHLL